MHETTTHATRLLGLGAAVLLLGACASHWAPETRRVAVLGYAAPPRVVVAPRGPSEACEPWLASLRRAQVATIAAELPSAPSAPYFDEERRVRNAPPSRTPTHASTWSRFERERRDELADICRAANEATTDGPALDEIVVLRVFEDARHDTRCKDTKYFGPSMKEIIVDDAEPGGRVCVRWRYNGTTVTTSLVVETVRVSRCARIATRTLATHATTSSRGAGVEYTRESQLAEVAATDQAAATRVVRARMAATAEGMTWNIFPRTFPILDARDGVVEVGTDAGHALASGASYWLKDPTQKALRQGIHAVREDAKATTLVVGRDLQLSPGDELHLQTDIRRTTLYTSVGGGVVRADGERNGLALASLALRLSFDRFPLIAEVAATGSLAPDLEAARSDIGGAAGLRIPLGPFGPLAFGELGLSKAYRSGATAIGPYAGIGVGADFWRGDWFVFADVRRRWLHLETWKSDDGVALAEQPDDTWITTTVQLGGGRRF